MLWAAPFAPAADIRVVEEIAAKVNGDIITKGDLEDQRKNMERALREEQHLSGAALAAAMHEGEKDILANQISQRLLVQRAKDMQINVDSEVNKQLIKMQLDSKIQDTEKFHEFIHQQLGMTFEDYKLQLTEAMLTRRVIDSEVGSRINIPEADLKKYYDDHQSEFMRKSEIYLAKILISTEGKSPEQIENAEKKANELAARANAGERFSELAAANSDDPETARDGGQLPGLQPEQLRADLRDIIANTKKGATTAPIRDPQGFVIYKVVDRFDAGLAPFDDEKERIHQFLAEPKMQAKLPEFLNKLRQEAYLEIKDGYIDTQAAPGKDTRWHEVAPIKAQTVTKEEVLSTRKRKKFLGLFPHGKVPAKPVDTQTLGEPKDPSQTAAPAPDKTGPDKTGPDKTNPDKSQSDPANPAATPPAIKQ
jgi:peptidyl-prolyl cis-trans isomerase SurA